MIVEDAISIEADPAVVWRVTQDVERWPEWTPTVTSVERVDGGPFGLGSVARIKQPAQPEADWVVTEFVVGRKFVWESRRRGLHLVGSHEMVAEGVGTRNTLRVQASGLGAAVLGPMLRRAMERALSAENFGLKTRCEELARSARDFRPPHA